MVRLRGILSGLRQRFFPKVGDAVRRPFATVDSSMKIEEVVGEMRRRETDEAVVMDGEDVVGVLSAEDVLDHLLEEREAWGESQVTDELHREFVSLPAGADIEEAYDSLEASPSERIVVVEDGEVVGVLREEDVHLKVRKGYLSPFAFAKRFLVDTLAYISFWTLPVAFVQVYLVKISVPQFLAASAGGFVLTLFLAGLFGSYLDYVRTRFDLGP